MGVRLEAVSFDATDPDRVARFWAGLLGREIVPACGGLLLPGDATQVGLHVVGADSEKDGANRLHLHLTSAEPADQQRTVDAVLALGGRHLDVGQLPEEGHVVLADPGGNELCVIEAGNRFLAGCGFLGEVACDGTRDVGLFWSEALTWPLVWDENEETAIQSPDGGTKVARGGPPVEPKRGRNRQRFWLTATGVDAEVGRLTALGARLVGPRGDATELTDPDGNEFWLTASTVPREAARGRL